MATSALHVLTKESRTRLARLLLVVSEMFPEIMQELLIHDSISPRTLITMIENDKNISSHLNSKDQEIIKAMYQRGYADVDVIFAYKLLKYFNLIPAPTQKWGRELKSFDVSVIDVERVHHSRNSILHIAWKEVSEAELLKYLTDFIELGIRLDTYLHKNPGFDFFSKISSLQTNMIDAETEKQNTDALEDICELTLQLRHERKDNITLNIYYGLDFERMIQELDEIHDYTSG